MAEILLASMGRLTNTLVDLYLRHQVILNTIVVAYGIVLALAHTNLKRITNALPDLAGTEDTDAALYSLATDETGALLESAVRHATMRVIASPYYFSIHRINAPNLISVIGRKERLSRYRIDELLALQKDHQQRSIS